MHGGGEVVSLNQIQWTALSVSVISINTNAVETEKFPKIEFMPYPKIVF